MNASDLSEHERAHIVPAVVEAGALREAHLDAGATSDVPAEKARRQRRWTTSASALSPLTKMQ